MTRYLTTQAIVINHHRYQEADQIVTILTPNMGKLVVNAKGSRSPKSHRLGSLELGNIIKTQLYEKGDRYWLTDVAVVSHSLSSSKSLTQLNLVFYFLEITNHFVAENQQIDGVYSSICSLIDSINQNDFTSLIKYEMKLLETFGFGIPEIVLEAYNDKNYPECQKQIKYFLESIIEKPLHSSKLFK